MRDAFSKSKFNKILIFLRNNNHDGTMHSWKEFGADPIKIEFINWIIEKLKF